LGINPPMCGRVKLEHPRAAERRTLGRGREYPAADALPGAKIVLGAFAMVRVAAALPKGRSEEAQAALATLVDEAKRTAVVQKAIDAKGLKGVNVATK
jgi:polar amino acid transport system substrate-binding protein